MNSELISPSVI